MPGMYLTEFAGPVEFNIPWWAPIVAFVVLGFVLVLLILSVWALFHRSVPGPLKVAIGCALLLMSTHFGFPGLPPRRRRAGRGHGGRLVAHR